MCIAGSTQMYYNQPIHNDYTIDNLEGNYEPCILNNCQ